MNEYNVCALCLQESDLRKSHIIPKFVGKWLKENGTGFLVNAEDGATRVQDTQKIHLLCGDCEEKFSKFERYFANQIFFPFHQKKEKSFEYDENLESFIVSLSWRALKLIGDDFKKDNPHFSSFVDQAELHWREFLIGKKETVSPTENHILFLDYVKDSDIPMPQGFHWYTLHSTDLTIVVNDETKRILVYVKFPWMIFISSINPSNLKGWQETKVNKSGELKIPQSIKDDWGFLKFLQDRAGLALTSSSGPSPEVSQKRFLRAVEKDPQKFLESNTFRTMMVEKDTLRKEKMKDMPKSVRGIFEDIIKPAIHDPNLTLAENQGNKWASRIIADKITDLSSEDVKKLDKQLVDNLEKFKEFNRFTQTTIKTDSLWITFMINHNTTIESQRSKIVEEVEKLREKQIDVKIPIAIFSMNSQEDGVSFESGYYLPKNDN